MSGDHNMKDSFECPRCGHCCQVKGEDQKPVFVDQEYLERRWGVSGATLERDRSLKQGCKYFKIGGAIRYRLSDIEAYENKCLVETKAK